MASRNIPTIADAESVPSITFNLTAQQRRRLDAALRSRVWPEWDLNTFLTTVTMKAVRYMETEVRRGTH
jgi:hypothetical protein